MPWQLPASGGLSQSIPELMDTVSSVSVPITIGMLQGGDAGMAPLKLLFQAKHDPRDLGVQLSQSVLVPLGEHND